MEYKAYSQDNRPGKIKEKYIHSSNNMLIALIYCLQESVTFTRISLLINGVRVGLPSLQCGKL